MRDEAVKDLSRLRTADTDADAAKILCELAVDAGHEITDEMIAGMIWLGIFASGRSSSQEIALAMAAWTRALANAAGFVVELMTVDQ